VQFRLSERRFFGGHRFFFAVCFLLATLILFPYAERATSVRTHFALSESVAILVSVYAANVHRGVLIWRSCWRFPALFERIVLPDYSHAFFVFNFVLTWSSTQ